MYTRFIVKDENQKSQFDIAMPFQVRLDTLIQFTEHDIEVLRQQENFLPGTYRVIDVGYARGPAADGSVEWMIIAVLSPE